MTEVKGKKRMVSVFTFTLIFIVLIGVFIANEIYVNRQKTIELYKNNEQVIVNILANDIKALRQEKTAEEVAKILPGMFDAMGSHYLVYEEDEEIIFSKTLAETAYLNNLHDARQYWDYLSTQKVTLTSARWINDDGTADSITIIKDEDSIFEDTGLLQHQYSIILAVALVCLVMFSLLISYVGSLNRVERKLVNTSQDLEERNNSIEKYIEDSLNNQRPEGLISDEEKFEQNYMKMNKFYSIAVMRNLLSKSDSDDLKPVRLTVIRLVMSDKYYTVDEIYQYAEVITRNTRSRELMCEIRKGVFAIASFKLSDAEVDARKDRILKALEDRNSKDKRFVGFEGETFILGAGEDACLEDFEKIVVRIGG